LPELPVAPRLFDGAFGVARFVPDEDGGVNVRQPGRAVEFDVPPRFPAFMFGCAERVLFE
jgi:hypothetical protein